MRLFIAEKPSMAREISKCLPENKNIQKRNVKTAEARFMYYWDASILLNASFLFVRL